MLQVKEPDEPADLVARSRNSCDRSQKEQPGEKKGISAAKARQVVREEREKSRKQPSTKDCKSKKYNSEERYFMTIKSR